MLINREKLREQLRRREIAPVYTLFGAESFLRDTAARYIADLCFAGGELREFNEAEFSLQDPENIRSAMAAAAQLPMMAAKRVVRINGVQIGVSSNRDTLKEDAEPLLASYLLSPSESSVVIFVADELNGNRKLSKLLKEKTVAVDFARLDEAGLVKWAADQVREQKAEADPRTIRHLVDLVGSDVRRLTNEVKKLSVAAITEGRISIELIDALVPNTREISNFGLTENLIAGRGKEALRILKKVLDDGIEPLVLLGLISSNYRRLLIASDMMSRGSSRNDVAAASKAPSGQNQEPFLAAARRLGAANLAAAIERISKTDLAIKTSVAGSGPSGARLQIEMLVCELAAM